jgi:hypothetical protein
LQSVFGNRSKTFKHTSEIPEIFAPVKVNTKILMLDCDINILSQDGCQQDRLTLPRTKTNNNKKKQVLFKCILERALEFCGDVAGRLWSTEIQDCLTKEGLKHPAPTPCLTRLGNL